MPTVRYHIRNEYGLSDPEIYRAVDKDDPEELLEGIAMAGLVGFLRQLGDLAEFASEVFHNLHEEVMATSARGHGLMLRVLQLEAEFPSIEKAILSETDHSHCAYSAGIDWHANLRVQQNLFSQGDMPRFILDSYEECRGPPRLFILDKFDIAGAGACLTRYSNPSFFKTASAFSEIMYEAQREKKARKTKKKGSCWKSGETTESFFTPVMDHLQFTASESAPGKFLARPVKLKHRKLRVSDISNRKSYMDGFLKEESFEQIDSKSSLSGFSDNKSIDGAPEAQEVPSGDMTDPLNEVSSRSLNEVFVEVQNKKRKDREILETVSISSSVSQKIFTNSQNAKEAMLVGLENEMDILAFDVSSDEIDLNPPAQLPAVNNILAVSGFTTDDDHDSCRSDDIGSELEHYVDALNTMESEIETDFDCRAKPDVSLIKCESQLTDPNVNGQLELRPRSPRLGFVGSFDTSVISEVAAYGMPNLSQSTILVDLPEQQCKGRTVFEEVSSLEFNHEETGKLEKFCEDMTLVSSASNEIYNKPNATLAVSTCKEAFTSCCIKDSDLKSQPKLEEAQSLAAHSGESNSGSKKNTSEIDEHVGSSFLSQQKNHFVVFPTCEERPDTLADVLEERNPIEYAEGSLSSNITDKGSMPCTSSETEPILLEKAPSERPKDLATLPDDGIGKPLEVSKPDKNDYISRSSLPYVHSASTVLYSQDTSNDFDIDVQYKDLTLKCSPNDMEGEDEEGKQLNSGVLFLTETHELSLVESNESGFHRFSQTSENANDVLACIYDEKGSPHGSKNNSVIIQLSGYAEKKTLNDLANTLERHQSPQLQAKSSYVENSSVCVTDSLHDSEENNNEAYYVENLSPKSSAFSFDIVSSVPKSETFATEIGNISTTQEKEHPQSSSSSENIDVLGCDAIIYPTIPYELEHFPDLNEPQEFSNVKLTPLPSICSEDPDVNQFHREVSELAETNGKENVHDELGIVNSSAKLIVQLDEQVLDENKINSFIVNGIPKGPMNDQIPSVIESAKVTTFEVLLQEVSNSENDKLHKPCLDIEQPTLPRDSTSLQCESKPYLWFIENEEIEIFSNSVSESRSFVQDLSKSSEAKLVNVKEDELHSRESDKDFDSKCENVVTEDDSDGGGFTLLQSSNVCNLDVQFQEDRVSEDAVLNLHKPVIEELNHTNSESKINIFTQDGSDGQNLFLLESSNSYRFDVQSQEDSVSMDVSLKQHKSAIQETAIESDLTSSTFESNLLTQDQHDVNISSSSQSQALDLSNYTYSKLADFNFDNIYVEDNLIPFRENEQYSVSNTSMKHFQIEAERQEVPSEKDSVSQLVDEPIETPLHRVLENIEPSFVQLDEVLSYEQPAIIQHNLEHEGLVAEPESETLPNHECKNELNVPSSLTYGDEETETNISVSFQGASETPRDSMASEALSSESLDENFMIPITAVGTHAQEVINALQGETMSSIPINEGIEETPPLPPLPPMQWRMGSSVHINPLPTSKEKMNLSSHSSGNIKIDGENPLTVAPSLGDVTSESTEGNPQATDERRPKLVKLLPGLEFERSLEAPSIIDRDAIPPLSSFMLMPTSGDGLYQYGYRDYAGYEGDSAHYHKMSAPFPVAVQSIPPYAYHMFLREGNSSAIYDIMLQDMEGDKPNERHHSIISRPRDPLIEAVAAHDKSTLRKVSELDWPLPKPKEDEKNYLLEQIKTKSLSLKPATSKANIVKAPSTNLKVAAILQKANAIRQACVGSDEDDDDSWNDS